ncbi:HAD hydrolase family protein, partial [Photobacterium damselae]|uniref:HAD hydrolase family protein n=1 Tax=Photobacterium damselae TaxID=38293 RepID=UPI004067C3A0
LDGTFLTPDHKLATFNQETLKRIHQQGKTFVFATGRHLIDVAEMREKIGIPPYMIRSNGARVHNGDGEVIFSQDLS